MRNCIFTAHCTEPLCDKSCPAYVETTYLLERNNLIDNDEVFASFELESQISEVIQKSEGGLFTYITPPGKSSVLCADLITYNAICKLWKGSQLHTSVYHVKYSNYIEENKKSWTSRNTSEELEYQQIWMKSAKLLVISHFDYVNFGDYESQTMLNLIQDRQSKKLTTILVSPPVASLVSTKSSIFFNSLKNIMKDSSKEVIK